MRPSGVRLPDRSRSFFSSAPHHCHHRERGWLEVPRLRGGCGSLLKMNPSVHPCVPVCVPISSCHCLFLSCDDLAALPVLLVPISSRLTVCTITTSDSLMGRRLVSAVLMFHRPMPANRRGWLARRRHMHPRSSSSASPSLRSGEEERTCGLTESLLSSATPLPVEGPVLRSATISAIVCATSEGFNETEHSAVHAKPQTR